MLIVARATGQSLRMTTEAGSVIEILIDRVHPTQSRRAHVVRLGITAPLSVKIDVKNEKPQEKEVHGCTEDGRSLRAGIDER